MEQSINASANEHNRYLQESISNIVDPFDSQIKIDGLQNKSKINDSNIEQLNVDHSDINDQSSMLADLID